MRELIDGTFMEVEAPTALHEWVVGKILYKLGAWTEEHGGTPLASGYKIRIDEHRGVMPDVQFFRPGNLKGHDPEGLSRGAPDLVVEVVSATSRRYDRVTKLAWYASIGVGEYWIIDPELQTLERLVLTEGKYRIADALEGEILFEPESFPGLSIDLAKLWKLPE